MVKLADQLRSRAHVIWDWNGTLLNDVDLCVDVVSEVLADHDKPPITRDQYRAIFRFPVSDYYEDLGLEKNAFEEITYKFVERYNARAKDCPLFDGVHDLLAELNRAEVPMSVLSAANEVDLKDFLSHHQLSAYFEQVFGIHNHFAAGKVERGKQLLQRLDLDPATVVLVGDTDHDAKVAQELGVHVLLLGDGHQCHTRLETLEVPVLRSRYGKK